MFYIKREGAEEYPEGNQIAVDLQKGNDRIDFGFGLYTNASGYLEVVRIVPNSSAAQTPIEIGDLLVKINNDNILRKGKQAYFAAIKKLAEGSDAVFLFCHPASRSTAAVDISDEQKLAYFNRLTSAIDNNDIQAIQALNTGDTYFDCHIQLMNSFEVWPLHRAIKNDCDAIAELLIGCGILDLDAYSDTYQGSPLTLAVLHNKVDVIKQLLTYGANPSCQLQSTWSPLRIAIRLGLDDVAMELAERHDDLSANAVTEAYKCLIHLAVVYGRLELLNHWLIKGVDPNQSVSASLSNDPDFSPCRTLAAAFLKFEEALDNDGKERRKNVVTYLLKKGAVIDNNITTTCSSAVYSYISSQKENFAKFADFTDCRLATIDYNHWFDRDLLVELNLSKNDIKFLPSSIPWDLPKVERFTMNDCGMLSELSGPRNKKPVCKRLIAVQFCNNPMLTTVAIDYFRLKNLVDLKITQCGLKNLPGNTGTHMERRDAWKCYKLESLNVRLNQLSELPKSIKLLRNNNIRIINASKNKLSTFPASWSNAVLEHLDLSENLLTNIDVSKFNKSLKILTLNHNEFSTFPESICELERLKILDLSRNNIEHLPECEWKCRNLMKLYLAENMLGDYVAPSSTNPPVKLTVTSLFKRITSNSTLSNDSNWSVAAASNTLNTNGSPTSRKISTNSSQAKEVNLPKICEDKLSELKLNNNRLTVVPESVLNFKQLTKLDISSNAISKLPPALASFRRLQELKVAELNLTELPKELNPALTTTVSTKSIMNFLSGQLRNKVGFRRAKMIVLGDDSCGKTTLIKKLIGDDNYFVQDSSIIGIASCTLHSRSNETENNIEVSIQELRGQKYQPIHRVFMTAKAIYMIAVQIDKFNPKSIHTFLLSIKERSAGDKNPKIIVVAMHFDCQKPIKVNVEQKFEEIKIEIAKIANSIGCSPLVFREVEIGTNVRNALWTLVESQVKSEKVPKSYVTIADQISMRKSKCVLNMTWILSVIRNFQILDFDIHDPEEIENVVSLFNERGVFLHHKSTLKNDSDEWFYVEPVWLSRALIAVFDNPKGLRKRKLSDVYETLATSLNSVSCVQDVYELMRSFELVQILDDINVLVLSDLPQDAPEMDVRLNGPCVCRLFRMKNTPPGFWSRLIGRLVHMFGAVPLVSATVEAANTNSRDFLLPGRIAKNCQRMWTQYWAKGFLLKSNKGLLRVEPLEKSAISDGIGGGDLNEGVLVRWHWMNGANGIDWSDEPYFGMTIDETDRLLHEWYPNSDYDDATLKRDAYCSVCAEALFGKKNHEDLVSSTEILSLFSLKVLTGLATVDRHVSCIKHPNQTVALEHLIPDLLLFDIPNIHRVEQGIKIIRPLGDGGQADVFEARWPAERECAAKTFVHPEEFERQLSEYTTEYTRATQNMDSRLSFSNRPRASNYFSIRASAAVPSLTSRKEVIYNRDYFESETLKALTYMRREASILCTLNHPFIVKLLGILVEPRGPFFIVLELAKEGDLYDFIVRSAERKRTFETEFVYGLFIDRHLIIKLAYQIVIALEYLHKEQIIYRDLKGQNVLLFSTDPKAHVNAKLADFGIACQADPQGNIGQHGTIGYQAPELLSHTVYNDQVDIYSYGMLIYLLLTAKHPFYDDMSYITDNLRAGRRPSLAEAKVKPNVASLELAMKLCWGGKSMHRPSASKLRKNIETLSFYSLRYHDIEPPPDSLPNGSWGTCPMILGIPQSRSVFIVSRDNDRYQTNVIDTETGESVLRSFATNKRITLLTASTGLIFCLCSKSNENDPEESVLILQASDNQTAAISVPAHIGTLKLHYDDETNATAICAFQNQQSPVEHKFFVGYLSGKIARYTLHFNDKDKPEWNDSRIVRKADSLAIGALLCCKFGDESNTELLVAVGNKIESLNLVDDTVIRTFTPFDDPSNYRNFTTSTYIQVVDETIWIGGQTLSSIAKISVTQEQGAAIELIDLEKDAKLLGIRLVAGNLWCAFAHRVLIMDISGSVLGTLRLPNSSFETKSIEAIEVCNSGVVVLTLTSYDTNKKPLPSKTRLTIWEMIDKDDIEQLKLDWKRWENF